MSFLDFKIMHYNSIENEVSNNNMDFSAVYAWFFNPLPMTYNSKEEKYVLNSIGKDELELCLREYCRARLDDTDLYETFKQSIEIRSPNLLKGNNVFSLSQDKINILNQIIDDEKKRKEIVLIFNDLFFTKPFYIGKADVLSKRVNVHLKSNSKIMKSITREKVSYKHIYLGYKKIDIDTFNDENTCDLLEEIFQRIFLPSLTKRPG